VGVIFFQFFCDIAAAVVVCLLSFPVDDVGSLLIFYSVTLNRLSTTCRSMIFMKSSNSYATCTTKSISCRLRFFIMSFFLLSFSAFFNHPLTLLCSVSRGKFLLKVFFCSMWHFFIILLYKNRTLAQHSTAQYSTGQTDSHCFLNRKSSKFKTALSEWRRELKEKEATLKCKLI
jgi:hypothetical protein